MSFPDKRGKVKTILGLILGLVILLVLSGCNSSGQPRPGDSLSEAGQNNQNTEVNAPDSNPVPMVESPIELRETQQHQVVIYRLTQDGEYLLPITITVNSEGSPLEACLQQLSGWQDEWSKRLLPEGIDIGNVRQEKGTVYLDLVGDFSKINLGSGQEAKIIDGLVRTATQFPETKQVVLLLNGEKAETLAGHIAIDQPLTVDPYVNLLQNEQAEGTKIQLYFSDTNAMYMIPVTVSVPKTKAVARTAVELLISGPKSSSLGKTIPKGVKLLGIDLEDGIARVDFSRELRDNHWGGSSGESATISSIVYTLTGLPGVEKVQILIEGKTGQSIAGHMILDQAFGRGNVNFRG